jgi:hypothetical protein
MKSVGSGQPQKVILGKGQKTGHESGTQFFTMRRMEKNSQLLTNNLPRIPSIIFKINIGMRTAPADAICLINLLPQEWEPEDIRNMNLWALHDTGFIAKKKWKDF